MNEKEARIIRDIEAGQYVRGIYSDAHSHVALGRLCWRQRLQILGDFRLVKVGKLFGQPGRLDNVNCKINQ